MDITTEKILLGTTSGGDGAPEDHWVTFTTSGVKFRAENEQMIALDVNDDGEVFVAGCSWGKRYNNSIEPVNNQCTHHFKLNPDGNRAYYKVQAGGGVPENPNQNDYSENLYSCDIRANKTGGGYWTLCKARRSRTNNPPGDGVLYNRFNNSGSYLGSTHMMRTISNPSGGNVYQPNFAHGKSTDKQAATLGDNDQLNTEQVSQSFNSNGVINKQAKIRQGGYCNGPSVSCWAEANDMWIMTPYKSPTDAVKENGSVILQMYGDGQSAAQSAYIIKPNHFDANKAQTKSQYGIRVTDDYIYALDYSGYTSSSQEYIGIYKISRATGTFVWRRRLGYTANYETRPRDNQGPRFDIDDDGNCYVIINPARRNGSGRDSYYQFEPYICKVNGSTGQADWYRTIEFTTKAYPDTIEDSNRDASTLLHDIKVKGNCMYIAMAQYHVSTSTSNSQKNVQIGVMKAPLDGSLMKTFNFPSDNQYLKNGIFRYDVSNSAICTTNTHDELSSFSATSYGWNQNSSSPNIYEPSISGIGIYTNDLDA